LSIHSFDAFRNDRGMSMLQDSHHWVMPSPALAATLP